MIVRRKRELHFNLGNYESITLTAEVEDETGLPPEQLDTIISSYLEADINRARLMTALDNTQSSIHEEIWK
jgi:hypothetical protein